MSVDLCIDDVSVARYHDGAEMAPELSPRPYLTASTRGGTPVTEVLTDDHAHHYGLSLALPDVDGVSFWGGRTYVRDVGSTLLPNHGIQRSVERQVTPGQIVERLALQRPDGSDLLEEERRISVAPLLGGWRIDWTSRLRAGEAAVTLGSPQTNGRPGAFYGGIFWRTPFSGADAMTAEGDGTELAHGSSSPWLALATDAASIVAWTDAGFPWFVRTEGYVGFGPAVAVDARREIPAGGELVLELRALVVDGRLGREGAERLASALAAPPAAPLTLVVAAPTEEQR